MSKEIKEVINQGPVLLSQAFRVGEFVGRHFHHSIFGFGTIQTNIEPCLGMSSEVIVPVLRIKWDYEGTFKGADATDYYEEDTIESINKIILDEERVKEEINEDAFDMIEEGPFKGFDRCIQDIKISEIRID